MTARQVGVTLTLSWPEKRRGQISPANIGADEASGTISMRLGASALGGQGGRW